MLDNQRTEEQATALANLKLIEAITAKHLKGGVKKTVYYDSVREAKEDPKRYGSVWLQITSKKGFYQVVSEDGEPI